MVAMANREEPVNEAKPSWPSFFAWPVVGAALAVSVLSAILADCAHQDRSVDISNSG